MTPIRKTWDETTKHCDSSKYYVSLMKCTCVRKSKWKRRAFRWCSVECDWMTDAWLARQSKRLSDIPTHVAYSLVPGNISFPQEMLKFLSLIVSKFWVLVAIEITNSLPSFNIVFRGILWTILLEAECQVSRCELWFGKMELWLSVDYV